MIFSTASQTSAARVADQVRVRAAPRPSTKTGQESFDRESFDRPPMPARATSAFSSAGAAHASRLGKIGRSVPEGERWIVTNWADGTVIDPLTELEFGISGKKQKRADIGGVDALGKSAGSMPGAIAEMRAQIK
jgi:hypothetical protein